MKSPSTPLPRKIKVAIVIPKYGLVGGAERFVAEVTERMAREGRYEFHVFANQWRAEEGSPVIFHKVHIIRFPRFLKPYGFPWFVQRKIARGGFDLVHSHDRLFHADIFSLHCVPHNRWIRDVRKKRPSLYDRGVISLERSMIKNGGESTFLTVSSLAEETFSSEYEPLPGNWQIVHPCVDVARFSSPDRGACRSDIRGKFGISASDLLVLFVGMNFELKGLDTVMEAIARAEHDCPEKRIHLLVVGKGNEAKYRKLAGSLNIVDNVTFAGTLSVGIERFYRAADLFIMLSSFDTFGMVVLEAMAAGLPVIVSSNVGAKDLVENGVNGFILNDAINSDSAADLIVRLRNDERRNQMGKAAAETASHHDWDKLVGRMSAVYQEVLYRKGVA